MQLLKAVCPSSSELGSPWVFLCLDVYMWNSGYNKGGVLLTFFFLVPGVCCLCKMLRIWLLPGPW